MTDEPSTIDGGPPPHGPAEPGPAAPGRAAPAPSEPFEPFEPSEPSEPFEPEPLEPRAAAPEPRSRLVAGVLGILLGALGAHSLYLGYSTKAKLQLAVSIVTCGIGGIWGATEGVLILVHHEAYREDAHGVPLVD